jgi:hypothetical protein
MTKDINSPKKPKSQTNPVWLSISEASKLGGVMTKTIRRAIKKNLKFKVVGNRYYIDLSSLLNYLHQTTKLKNKLHEHGLGQYVKEWKNLN